MAQDVFAICGGESGEVFQDLQRAGQIIDGIAQRQALEKMALRFLELRAEGGDPPQSIERVGLLPSLALALAQGQSLPQERLSVVEPRLREGYFTQLLQRLGAQHGVIDFLGERQAV